MDRHPGLCLVRGRGRPLCACAGVKSMVLSPLRMRGREGRSRPKRVQTEVRKAEGMAPVGTRLVRAAGAGSVTGMADNVHLKEGGPLQNMGRY